MPRPDQCQLADHFYRLHTGFLVLPNAWDPPSARLVTSAGSPAIATTSAGVAWSRGVADAGGMNRAVAMDAAARVVAAVAVPVTVDIEDGYEEDDGGIEGTIEAVIDAGAVGVNIEDSRAGRRRPASDFAALIARAIKTSESRAMRLFVNARVDTYLMSRREPSDELLGDAIDRAHAYVEEGADGIFVPGLADHGSIATIASAIDVPLNVMVGPGSGSLRELADLGVRRVSCGPALTTAAYGEVGRWAQAMLGGSLDALPASPSPDELVGSADDRLGP